MRPSEILSVSENELKEISEKDRSAAWPLSDRWTEAMFRGWLPDGQRSFLAERGEDGLHGYVLFSHVCEDSEIIRIAVFPPFLRQGVAERLLEAAFETAKRRGAERMFLEVRASNVPARRLYEKSGFETYGVRKDYYKREREDAVLMKKQL